MKRFAFFFAALTIAFSCSAQSENKPADGNGDYTFKPYTFIGLQGGITNTSITEYTYRKWAPQGALSFGAYFLPFLGARLQANSFSWIDHYNGHSMLYDTYLGPNVDLLFNLSGLFSPNKRNFLDVVLLAGGGLNYPLFQREFPTDPEASLWAPSVKGGAQLNFNVSKRWALNVEGGMQRVFKHFENTSGDKWWPYAMVGLTCRLGKTKTPVAAPEPIPVVEEKAETVPVQPVVEEKKPVVVPKPEPKVEKAAPARQSENVFFRIGRSSIDAKQAATVDQIAQWAKEHPEALITLTGYADKGTGTARINQAISERRAAAVKDALVKRGIKASRIATDAKGDTIQPFGENDKNRVVIAVSEEK
jgi:outer membrane protein OmpA-like peptidoglycan-associated protein